MAGAGGCLYSGFSACSCELSDCNCCGMSQYRIDRPPDRDVGDARPERPLGLGIVARESPGIYSAEARRAGAHGADHDQSGGRTEVLGPYFAGRARSLFGGRSEFALSRVRRAIGASFLSQCCGENHRSRPRIRSIRGNSQKLFRHDQRSPLSRVLRARRMIMADVRCFRQRRAS